MKKFKTINKTSAIYQTNPRLTGNVKIVMDATTDIVSLEQLDSNIDTSTQFSIDHTEKLGVNISNFYKDGNFGTSFHDVENGNVDSKSIVTDYGEQIDDSLTYGTRVYTQDNNYNKIKFFAPIWINPKYNPDTKNIDSNIPTHFVLFKQKIDINNPNDNNDISSFIQNGEIVNLFDLKNSKLGTMLEKHLTQDSLKELQGSPMRFSVDAIRWYGINLNNGLINEYSQEYNNTLEAEHTILSHDNYLTNGWFKNSAIVPNLFNLEFIFNDPSNNDFEYYSYFGTYINVGEEISINKDNFIDRVSDLTNYPLFHSSNTELLSYVISDTGVVHVSDIESNQNSSNAIDLTVSNLVNTVTANENEVIKQIQTRRCFLSRNTINDLNIGDTFKVLYDGTEEVSFTCSTVNDATNYKLEVNEIDTLNNIINVFNSQFLNADQTFLFNASIEGDFIIIDSRSYVDGLDITFEIPNSFIFSTTRLSDINTNYLPNVVHTSKSLKLSKNKLINGTNVGNDILIENLKNSSKVHIYGNGIDIETTVSEITINGDNFYITFEDSFNPDENINTNFSFKVYTLSDSKCISFKYVEIVDFDNTLGDETYNGYIDYEHTIEVFKQYMYNRVSNNDYGGGYQQVPMFDYVNDYFSFQTELNVDSFIGNIDISDNSIDLTNNPYNRFIENDLQEYSTINVVNTMINKWGSNNGENAVNQVFRANSLMSYGTNNFTPHFTSTNRARVSDLICNWFIIGTQPPLYTITDNNIERSFLNKSGLTRAMLLDPTIDLYNEYLTYVRSDGSHNFTEVSYSYVYRKPYSDTCNALFRGVMYNLPREVEGYKFSVIYIPSDVYVNKPRFEAIQNDEYKTYTILMSYRWTFDFIASLYQSNEDNNYDNYFIDRSVFYNTNPIRVNGTIYANQEVLLNMEIGNFNTRVYESNVINNTAYEGTAPSNNGFAVDFINPNPQIYDMENLHGFEIGGNMSVLLPLGQGYISFINITEIHDEYFWCENIYYSKVVNGIPEPHSFDDYLVTNGNDFVALSQLDIFIEVQEKIANAQIQYNTNWVYTRIEEFFFSNARVKIKEQTGIDVNEPTKAYTYNVITAEKGELSHTLGRTETPFTLIIDRHNISTTPIVQSVFRPRSVEINSIVYDGYMFSNIIELDEFGIFKYGDGGTLSTDGEDETGVLRTPKHTLLGETITDKITFNPYSHSLVDNYYRKYTYRHLFEFVNGSEYPNDNSSIISTVFRMGEMKINFNVSKDVTGVFIIDVANGIKDYLKTLSVYSSISDNIVYNVALEILERYTPTLSYTNLDNEKIESGINVLYPNYIVDGLITKVFNNVDTITVNVVVDAIK